MASCSSRDRPCASISRGCRSRASYSTPPSPMPSATSSGKRPKTPPNSSSSFSFPSRASAKSTFLPTASARCDPLPLDAPEFWNGGKKNFRQVLEIEFTSRGWEATRMLHRVVFHNDKLLPIEQVRLSPGQAGLLNGWGLFSTLRITQGEPFAYERHWRRLEKDAARTHCPFPFEAERVRAQLAEVIRANQVK